VKYFSHKIRKKTATSDKQKNFKNKKHTHIHTVLTAIFNVNLGKLVVVPFIALTGRWDAIRYYSLYPTQQHQLSWVRGFNAKILQAECPSWHPTNSIKSLKGKLTTRN